MLKKMIKVILIVLVIIALVIILGMVVYYFSPQRGGKPQSYDSPNFKDGRFRNLIPTSMMAEDYSILKSMYDFYIKSDPNKSPEKPIETKSLEVNKKGIAWLGHSTVLMKLDGLTIIADPMLNGNRIPPFYLGPKPFEYTNKYHVEDLPDIDVVLISHDHMDHLDMDTIKKLKDSTFFVPLGIKSHLLRWGVVENNITELDWYGEIEYKNAKLALTPSRHFSGRGLFNRDSTLWGGWAIHYNGKKIYFGGDSGYFEEFKKIGDKYGPFDLVMLDTGQYDEKWQLIHFLPEEVIKATIDLKAKAVLPIHNSKYVLALHPWFEPLERVIKEGEAKDVFVTTPQIGETFSLEEDLPQSRWWRE